MYYWNHSETRQQSTGNSAPRRLMDKTPSKKTLSDLTTTQDETELYVTADNTQDALIATPKNFGSRLPRSSVSTPKEGKSPDDAWTKQISDKDSRITELEQTILLLRKELEESRTFSSINDFTTNNAYKTPPPIRSTVDSSLQFVNSGEDNLVSPLKLSKRTNSSNLCDLKVVTKTFHVFPPPNENSDTKNMTENNSYEVSKLANPKISPTKPEKNISLTEETSTVNNCKNNDFKSGQNKKEPSGKFFTINLKY